MGTYRVFNVNDDAGGARCEAVVDGALASGIRLFDSSPMYGHAERVLADALGERRGDAVVATKVWARTRAVGEAQIERALEWFERVELFQVHNLLAAGDHLPLLHHLKGEGRISAVGASQYLTRGFAELSERMGSGELEVIEIPYHPLECSAQAELLPAAEALGVGVIAMTPLGAGRLLRRYPPDEELAPLAPYGVHTWPQAVLKWILSDRRVQAVIPATSSPEHVRENAAAGEPPWFTNDERQYVQRLAERYQ